MCESCTWKYWKGSYDDGDDGNDVYLLLFWRPHHISTVHTLMCLSYLNLDWSCHQLQLKEYSRSDMPFLGLINLKRPGSFYFCAQRMSFTYWCWPWITMPGSHPSPLESFQSVATTYPATGEVTDGAPVLLHSPQPYTLLLPTTFMYSI